MQYFLCSNYHLVLRVVLQIPEDGVFDILKELYFLFVCLEAREDYGLLLLRLSLQLVLHVTNVRFYETPTMVLRLHHFLQLHFDGHPFLPMVLYSISSAVYLSSNFIISFWILSRYFWNISDISLTLWPLWISVKALQSGQNAIEHY